MKITGLLGEEKGRSNTGKKGRKERQDEGRSVCLRTDKVVQLYAHWGRWAYTCISATTLSATEELETTKWLKTQETQRATAQCCLAERVLAAVL